MICKPNILKRNIIRLLRTFISKEIIINNNYNNLQDEENFIIFRCIGGADARFLF